MMYVMFGVASSIYLVTFVNLGVDIRKKYIEYKIKKKLEYKVKKN